MTLLPLLVALALGSSLPGASEPQRCHAKIVVHRDGSVEFDGAHVPGTVELRPRLVDYAKHHPGCALDVVAEKKMDFKTVGRIVLELQKAGFLKVGFLTEPESAPGD